jgi:hypothetical protein
MADIVNLNRVRKSRARVEKQKTADVNAVKFGRTKAERLIDVVRDEKARKMLDQHEMEEE